MEGLEHACLCWDEMSNVNGRWGGARAHAQGLEGLDGVERPKFDKCLDDVKAPWDAFVKALKERLRLYSLVKEDVVGRRFVRIPMSELLPLDLEMLEESLNNHWKSTVVAGQV